MGTSHFTPSKGLNFSLLRISILIVLIIFKGHAVMAQTPSAATSTVSASSRIVATNGTTTLTIQLKDGSGNNITSGGASVSFNTPSAGSIGSVTDNNNGTYTAVYTAGVSAGSITITPRLSGVDFTNTVVITVGNGQLLKSNPAGTSTNTTSYSTAGGLALVLGLDVDYLIVGGGGGGGGGVNASGAGGGGGGGGGRVSTGSTAVEFTSHTATVGSGGAGGNGASSTADASPGTSGGSSSIFGITSSGGGAGGGGKTGGGQSDKAGDGGESAEVVSGSQTTRTGGYNDWDGAGGGAGAGSNGSNGVDISGAGGKGGNGGNGVVSSINGNSVTYGGGGGGGGSWDGSGSYYNDGSGGTGGSGGGGQGAQLTSTNAVAGTNNLGGGGGGGGYTNGSASTTIGGAGGSGVVIIRYQGSDIATGGSKSTVTVSSQSYNVHTFNEGGTFSLTPTNAYLSTLSASYSGVLSGTGALTYNNLGTLDLTGANTYSGGTNILNGTLKFSGVQANVSTNLITLTGSSTLVFNVQDVFTNHTGTPFPSITLNNGTTLTNSGAVYNVLGPLTLSGGTISYNSNSPVAGKAFAFKNTVTVNGSTTSTISGDGFELGASGVSAVTFDVSDGSAEQDLLISGVLRNGAATNNFFSPQASSLTKAGSGKMVLSGSNTYTGSTTISAGVLNIQNNTGAGTTAGGVTVSSGAALELQGGITIGAEALTINSSGVSSGGALRNISGNNTWGGTITQASASRINSDAGTLTLSASNAITGTYNLTIGGAGNTTVSGTITTGTGTLTKDGTGTLTLAGTNTYTGTTTVSAGTLQLNRTGGTTIPSTNNVTVSGGILKVSTSQELNNLSVTSGTLVVDAGVTLTISGTFTGGGTITNNGTIVIKGSSTFPGSTTTISAMNNLEINRPAGVTLDKDMTVTGTLTLTSGVLDVSTTTLTVSGTISGATSAKYIKTSSTGGLKQSVSNSAVAFPVGNSSYNPITLTNNTGAADNFTARVIDEVYANGTSSGTTVSTLRVKRTWDIAKTTPSANAGTGVDMVFNWDPASHTSGTLVIPKMYHYESSSWVKKSIISNTTYDVVAGTLTFTGYKGDFSPFAIMDDGTALPVTWISFTGRAIHGEVELNWSTASEQNNSHFEVERSADAVLFNKIGRVNAAANPRIRNDYRYIDQQPIIGRSFYRLKQVDMDGKFSYSSIIQISGVVPQGFRTWVLPGTSQLTLQIPQTITTASTLQVYDAAGRMVVSKQVLPGLNQVDLTMQSGGVYYVRVLQGSLMLYSGSVVK